MSVEVTVRCALPVLPGMSTRFGGCGPGGGPGGWAVATAARLAPATRAMEKAKAFIAVSHKPATTWPAGVYAAFLVEAARVAMPQFGVLSKSQAVRAPATGTRS